MSNVTRGKVWSDPRNECEGKCESLDNSRDSHNLIANDLAEKIAGIVTNSYANRDIIKNLISNAIREQIRQYLREYDNVVAEDILNSLKRFDLGEVKGWTSEIAFDNARHAKMWDFGVELKKEFDRLKKDNQLERVKKRVLALNPEPGTETDSNDGKIWLSNVLVIIDEELNPPKEVVPEEKTDNPTPGVDVY